MVRYIARWNGATWAALGGSGGLDNPIGLAFGLDGNFYVSSRYTDSVLSYVAQPGAFIDEFVASGSSGMYGP